MDPNQTIEDLRDAIYDEDLERIEELFEGLDDWLRSGGSPPDEWTPRSDAVKVTLK